MKITFIADDDIFSTILQHENCFLFDQRLLDAAKRCHIAK